MGKLYEIVYLTTDGQKTTKVIGKDTSNASLVFNRQMEGSDEVVIDIESIFEIKKVNGKYETHKSYDNDK